jgi:hypothetical protein
VQLSVARATGCPGTILCQCRNFDAEYFLEWGPPYDKGDDGWGGLEGSLRSVQYTGTNYRAFILGIENLIKQNAFYYMLIAGCETAVYPEGIFHPYALPNERPSQ